MREKIAESFEQRKKLYEEEKSKSMIENELNFLKDSFEEELMKV